jgi:hypothetical protein
LIEQDFFVFTLNYLQAYIVSNGTVIGSFFHRSFTDFIFIQPLKIPKDPKINNFADKTINRNEVANYQGEDVKRARKMCRNDLGLIVGCCLLRASFIQRVAFLELLLFPFSPFIDQTGFVQLQEPVSRNYMFYNFVGQGQKI